MARRRARRTASCSPLRGGGGGGEPFSVGPLGAADRRCWRYLGSAEVSVAQGDHILCEGKRYRVRRAESVKLGALVTHYWAVLDREEETA